MSNSVKTVILGIGNTLLGDEGAGVRTMELLRDSHTGDCVEFVDGGTLSFSLSQYIEEADNLTWDEIHDGALPRPPLGDGSLPNVYIP